MGAVPAQKDQASSQHQVGKKELCAALNWSRPRLDRELLRDPKFPVLARGDQAGGWKFSVVAVKAYLAGGHVPASAPPPAIPAKPEKPTPKAKAIDQAQLRAAVAPPMPPDRPRRSAEHRGEASARQRKDEADAALKENKLRLENAEIVPASDVRQVWSDIFAGLASDLDVLPEDIQRKLELPDTAVPLLRKFIDDVRIAMVKRAEALLPDAQ